MKSKFDEKSYQLIRHYCRSQEVFFLNRKHATITALDMYDSACEIEEKMEKSGNFDKYLAVTGARLISDDDTQNVSLYELNSLYKKIQETQEQQAEVQMSRLRQEIAQLSQVEVTQRSQSNVVTLKLQQPNKPRTISPMKYGRNNNTVAQSKKYTSILSGGTQFLQQIKADAIQQTLKKNKYIDSPNGRLIKIKGTTQ